MRKNPDVLVIGGGAVGVCSAYYIAQKGLRVALVEKEQVASGCSGANAGLIVPSYCIPLANPEAFRSGVKSLFQPCGPFAIKPRPDPDLFRWMWQFRKASQPERMQKAIPLLRELNYESFRLLQELIATESLPCQFRQVGWLVVCNTPEEFGKARENAALLGAHKIESKILGPEESLEMEATLHPKISGSVFYPDDAHFEPKEFVRSLAKRLRDRRVHVQEKAEVLRIEATKNMIKTVHTTRGDYRPQQVVLAAGFWTRGLMKSLRVRLPVQSAKGYCISVKKPGSSPSLPLYFSDVKVAATPLSEVVRFAGMLEVSRMDLKTPRPRVDRILRAGEGYLNSPEKWDVVEIRAGLRPCTPDGLPIIERSSTVDNLIIATGHGMLGITQAPITGKLVSQIVSYQSPDVNLASYRLSRFSMKGGLDERFRSSHGSFQER
ncbi:MAG: NAD(P)/FAD-dependent oxidoreductase [Candidatus Aminicenantales bacterium]